MFTHDGEEWRALGVRRVRGCHATDGVGSHRIVWVRQLLRWRSHWTRKGRRQLLYALQRGRMRCR